MKKIRVALLLGGFICLLITTFLMLQFSPQTTLFGFSKIKASYFFMVLGGISYFIGRLLYFWSFIRGKKSKI